MNIRKIFSILALGSFLVTSNLSAAKNELSDAETRDGKAFISKTALEVDKNFQHNYDRWWNSYIDTTKGVAQLFPAYVNKLAHSQNRDDVEAAAWLMMGGKYGLVEVPSPSPQHLIDYESAFKKIVEVESGLRKNGNEGIIHKKLVSNETGKVVFDNLLETVRNLTATVSELKEGKGFQKFITDYTDPLKKDIDNLKKRISDLENKNHGQDKKITDLEWELKGKANEAKFNDIIKKLEKDNEANKVDIIKQLREESQRQQNQLIAEQKALMEKKDAEQKERDANFAKILENEKKTYQAWLDEKNRETSTKDSIIEELKKKQIEMEKKEAEQKALMEKKEAEQKALMEKKEAEQKALMEKKDAENKVILLQKDLEGLQKERDMYKKMSDLFEGNNADLKKQLDKSIADLDIMKKKYADVVEELKKNHPGVFMNLVTQGKINLQ